MALTGNFFFKLILNYRIKKTLRENCNIRKTCTIKCMLAWVVVFCKVTDVTIDEDN